MVLLRKKDSAEYTSIEPSVLSIERKAKRENKQLAVEIESNLEF